jgi:ubiquitin thioesterase protein OTUB1
MQTNAVRYQHLLDIPLADYCRTRIEPTNPEIDEIGLQALLNGIIDGSGFSVEVLYLDRSQGTEVTSHVLLNSDPTFKTIRLLYRP